MEFKEVNELRPEIDVIIKVMDDAISQQHNLLSELDNRLVRVSHSPAVDMSPKPDVNADKPLPEVLQILNTFKERIINNNNLIENVTARLCI